MIDFVRTYDDNIYRFEDTILKNPIFDEVFEEKNKRTGDTIKIIATAKDYGLFVEIDEHSGYLTIILKTLLNKLSVTKIYKSDNLTISQIQTCLKFLEEIEITPENLIISEISIGIVVKTESNAVTIVDNNLVSHNKRYYNHNKKTYLKNGYKSFEREYFKIEAIGFSNDFLNQHFIKFLLTMKKRVYKKRVPANHLSDLFQNQVYELFFSILLERFNQLVIVDDIDFEIFLEKDANSMKEYLRYGYWKEVSEKYSPQTLSIRWKNFNRIIVKYKLNQIKNLMRLKMGNAIKRIYNN